MPAGPRWLNEDEMAAWRAFLHASVRVVDRLDADLRSHHELTLPDYEVISTLSEADGGRLRMTELAAKALVSKSRLSYRVDRLEQRGLVRRVDHPADKRGTFAVLTAKGRRSVNAAAVTHVEGVRTHLLDMLSEEEQATLGGSLRRVLDALDAASPGSTIPVTQIEPR